MYELAKDIVDQGRTIPAGTPVSDVYEMYDQSVRCIAHVWGQRIKLTVIPRDLRVRK